MPLVDVLLDVRSGGTGGLYTYEDPFGLALGEAVMVPLGNRTVLGFVYRTHEERPEYGLKPITNRVEGLGLPASSIELLTFVSREYLCPLPVALSSATPPGALERLAVAYTVTGAEEPEDLPRSQLEALRALRDLGGTVLDSSTKRMTSALKRVYNLLAAKGLVRKETVFRPFTERRASKGLYRLTRDAEKIERFLHKEGRRKPAQALTVMRMQSAGSIALDPAEIRALSPVTDQTLKALVTAGLLEIVEEGTQPRRPAPQPTEAQSAAIAALSQAIQSREFRPFLLFGITGSGKTEVFLRAASEALKEGRQMLYLVPEIALAAQAISLLRDRFGDRVAIFHSELTPRERLENWSRVRKGELPVVLGARSALFAPLSNLGLIIVDEEHETSYKQDSAPRYHAKTVAKELARLHGATLVLGSATPSVETAHEAERGELTKLVLSARAVAAARLPQVEIDDLAATYRSGQPSILAPLLHEKIEATLARQEQVILFLNRRAYAPFLLCRECGHQFACPRCAVSLSYSRHDRRIRCHHCDYTVVAPDICPECGGTKLSPLGIGTEKVEEAVQATFPSARVARLDRDVAQRKGALESILTDFRAEQIDILVGTQMVAKGLDFPNVTLVGVIVADVSLNLPDFRASERTFQLLTQVAGRAGRGQRPGEVVIQTFNPDHVAVVCAQTHDYLSLYDHLLQERREANYPPFCRLVNISVTGEDRQETIDTSYRVAIALEGMKGAQVLGPADATINRLQNRWRRQLLVKLEPGIGVAEIGVRAQGMESKGVMITLDVDPYNMV